METMQNSARATGKPLRVLQVNKFHFINGGSEVCYFGLTDLLRAHGHFVGHFSMRHPENVPSPEEAYFIDNVRYDGPSGLRDKLTMAARTIYSTEARRKIARLLDTVPFDIAHLHNFHHQISPSILPELKRRGIPIVFTTHDFKLICPNYKLYTHDGICERCKGHKFYNATVHRCTKGSRAASLINTVEMYAHHLLRYDDLYDVIVTPARFTGRKLVEFGIPEEKVVYAPNFVRVAEYPPQYEPGAYLLYLGRLSQEKGVHTLVAAMGAFPGVRLKITGRGPYEEEVNRIVRESGATHLELTGHLSGNELKETIRGAKAIVIPSEWYENCPLALIEAYAYGKPVIGARIGGLGEMVLEGETGFQFESGNVGDLVRVLREALSSESRLREMGMRARQRAEEEYDAEPQYPRIMAIYDRACAAARR